MSTRSFLRRTAALVLLTAAFAAGASASTVLPFIEDDYTKALAEARAKGVPIFLEAWAPWCHSCRSMQAFVYSDAKLAPYAGRFVWLSIDTEKAGNATTVAKFPVSAWPSVFVIDPASETVSYRWTGSATIEQLTAFLDEARGAAGSDDAMAKRRPPTASGASGGNSSGSPLDLALERADKLYGAAAWDAAATAYAAAIAHAPKDWPRLARAADAFLYSLVMADRGEECVRAARELLPRLAGAPASVSVAVTGLDCAVGLDAKAAGRGTAIAELERVARAALEHPPANFSVDDRSGVYISLISARDDAKDEAGKKKLETAWIAELEEGAAKASNPAERAVFDSHRVGAYLEIGEPQRAIPMLEASERDFPDDYNPPARLAVIYLEMKDYKRAMSASDRALTRGYGPRRMGILRTRARILVAAGDIGGAKAVLNAAIAEGEALPEAQRPKSTLAALRHDLEGLNKPTAS